MTGSSLTEGNEGDVPTIIAQTVSPILVQIRDSLLTLDVDNLTPIQALNKLNEIKGILKG